MLVKKSASITGHQANRSFGLDLCRSIAILLVVTGHMLQHSMPHPLLSSIGFVGLFGVDLFFCLSGFLIGRILLTESENWHREREMGLLKFWFRRWTRTLPLYYFFFIVSLRFDWRGETSLSEHLSYLGFSQNIAWNAPEFFHLSWSLAVEEWFYFCLPLLVLLLVGIKLTAKQATATTVVVFLLLPPLLRYLVPSYPLQSSFDENLRHVVIFRLDALGWGVLIAYLARWHQDLFSLLRKLWWLFACIAASCVIYTKAGYAGLANSPFLAPLYFTVSAIGFAGLIPAFSKINPFRFSALNRIIRYTSLISYSMYLGHIFAFIFGIYLLKLLGVHNKIYPNPWLTYPLFYLIVYFFASITYFFIEKPILALRDKKPSNNFYPSASRELSS